MPSQLTYLKLNKFRHVRPGTELHFKPQFNVVVGQNGTGKTTLLNLISAIVRSNFHQFAGEDFSIEFRLVDGEVTLDGMLNNLVVNSRAKFEFIGKLMWPGGLIQVESSDTESSITQGPRKLRAASVVPAKSESEFALGFIYSILKAAEDAELAFVPPLDIAHRAVFSPMDAAKRLTEGADTFVELFNPEISQNQPQALGYTFVRASNGSVVSLGHALLPAFLSPQQLDSAEISDTVTLGSDVTPLATFVQLTQYQDARLILVKTTTGPRNGSGLISAFGSPLARFRTPNGNEIPHEHLSFGEKRLLVFLLKLWSHPATVIVDELANGMHHSWLEQCVAFMEDLGSQAFLTSQNPLLLDCLPINRETYATAHTFVVCELDDSGEMVWRNLTAAETEDFFRSLDVGLQHISEIMRAKGLW